MEQSLLFIQRDKVWEAIRKPDGAKRYVTKYVTKSKQKEPPAWFREVGRFWGHDRNIPREIPRVIEVNHSAGVEVVKAFNNKVGNWEVIPKVVIRFDNSSDE